MPTHRSEIAARVVKVSVGIVGTELDCLQKLSLGAWEIKVVVRLHLAENRMSFTEPRIQHQSFGGCCFGLRCAFPGGEHPEVVAHVVRIGEAYVCQREIWIFFHRLLKELNALLNASPSSLVPVISALQVKLIGLGVDRRGSGDSSFVGTVQT